MSADLIVICLPFVFGLCAFIYIDRCRKADQLEFEKGKRADLAKLLRLHLAIDHGLLPALRYIVENAPEKNTIAAFMIHHVWSQSTDTWLSQIAGNLYGKREELLNPVPPETVSLADKCYRRVKRLNEACLNCLRLAARNEDWASEYERFCLLAQSLASN